MWIYFFGVKPQPLRVNEAVKANDHIEQRDPGFLAGHPVSRAVYVLAAVLALIAHVRLSEQGICHEGNGPCLNGRSLMRYYLVACVTLLD